MILGEVIKRVRLRRKLTQEEVCRRANLTQGFYSTIENGATPSLETLYKLSEVFDLPIFSLMFLATEKKDVPKQLRGWYNTRKLDLDNIIEEAITTTQ